MIEMIHFTF